MSRDETELLMARHEREAQDARDDDEHRYAAPDVPWGTWLKQATEGDLLFYWEENVAFPYMAGYCSDIQTELKQRKANLNN